MQPAALIQTAPLPKQTAPLPRLHPNPCQPLQCQVHLLLALLTPAAAASTPAPDRIAFPALQLLRNHPIITAVFVTILLTLAALAMYYLASRTTITITAQNDIEKVELGLACAATLKDAAPKTIETVELGLAGAGIPDLEGLRLPATYLTDMGGNPATIALPYDTTARNLKAFFDDFGYYIRTTSDSGMPDARRAITGLPSDQALSLYKEKYQTEPDYKPAAPNYPNTDSGRMGGNFTAKSHGVREDMPEQNGPQPTTYLTDMGGNPVDHRRQCQIANRNMLIDAYKNHAPARLLPGKFDLIPNTTNLTTDLRDHEEEPDTSDGDDYSDMPRLEDPTDEDPASSAESYLGMDSDQLRYCGETYVDASHANDTTINKELYLAEQRKLYESQRTHLQKELERFMNFPTDTSNRSDYIEHASYIINTGNAFDTNFGMTGIDLENMDFIDDDDNYNDPESTDQPNDNDKRNSSNTELDFEYTQDVD
jgi:hypothetical protein